MIQAIIGIRPVIVVIPLVDKILMCGLDSNLVHGRGYNSGGPE